MSHDDVIGIINIVLRHNGLGTLEYFPPEEDCGALWQYDGGLDGVVVQVGDFLKSACSVIIEHPNGKSFHFIGAMGTWHDHEWIDSFEKALLDSNYQF